MFDPESAFTYGNRSYARAATGQNASFGDEESRRLREMIRQQGSDVSNLSQISGDTSVWVGSLPSAEPPPMGHAAPSFSTNFGPRSYNAERPHLYDVMRTNSHDTRNQRRSMESILKDYKEEGEEEE